MTQRSENGMTVSYRLISGQIIWNRRCLDGFAIFTPWWTHV